MAFSVRSVACQAHSVAPGSLGNGSDGMGSPLALVCSAQFLLSCFHFLENLLSCLSPLDRWNTLL